MTDPLQVKRDTRAALQRMWIRLNQWRQQTGLKFPADERKALLQAIKYYDQVIGSAEHARRLRAGEQQ